MRALFRRHFGTIQLPVHNHRHLPRVVAREGGSQAEYVRARATHVLFRWRRDGTTPTRCNLSFTAGQTPPITATTSGLFMPLASNQSIPDIDTRSNGGRRTFTHMAGIGWTRPMTARGWRRHTRRRGRRVRGRSRRRGWWKRGVVLRVVRSIGLVDVGRRRVGMLREALGEGCVAGLRIAGRWAIVCAP